MPTRARCFCTAGLAVVICIRAWSTQVMLNHHVEGHRAAKPDRTWHVCWSTGYGWEEHYARQLLSGVQTGRTWRSDIKSNFEASMWVAEEDALRRISKLEAAFCRPDDAADTNDDGIVLIVRNRQGSSEHNLAALERLTRRANGGRRAVVLVVFGDEGLPAACGESATANASLDASARARTALYASSLLVVKNYWSAGCAGLPNVLIVPFGPRSGVVQTAAVRRRWPRQYVWSFMSTHRTPARQAARALLVHGAQRHASLRRYHLDYRERLPNQASRRGHGAKNATAAADGGSADLPAEFYTRVLCDSVFALTPKGNVHDGALAVVKRPEAMGSVGAAGACKPVVVLTSGRTLRSPSASRAHNRSHAGRRGDRLRCDPYTDGRHLLLRQLLPKHTHAHLHRCGRPEPPHTCKSCQAMATAGRLHFDFRHGVWPRGRIRMPRFSPCGRGGGRTAGFTGKR